MTRDHGLLKRKRISHGYFVREDNPERQVREVLSRFDLRDAVEPFKRCTQCNGPIQSAGKEEVGEQLPGNVAREFDEFSRCGTCGRVYWKGSHYDHMLKIIAGLLQEEMHR